MLNGAEVRQLPGFPLRATMLQDVLSEGPIACLNQNIWSTTRVTEEETPGAIAHAV